MALPLAGEPIGIQEKVESIWYNPGLKDTGDLETGTNTITATSEASGTGNADYSQALTLPKPDDARLLLKRIAARLSVTIDSMTAGHLYCRVYVDVQDADHRLFDEDWTTTGAKLDAVDTYSGGLSTIFNLLKDGSAHTFYFFFWVDAGNAVISVVQLWEGVGSCSTSRGDNAYCLEVDHQGFVALSSYLGRQGTGTPRFIIPTYDPWLDYYDVTGHGENPKVANLLAYTPHIIICGSVATDLNYTSMIELRLRSVV